MTALDKTGFMPYTVPARLPHGGAGRRGGRSSVAASASLEY